MLIGLLLSMAFADTLTLDSGAALQGEVVVYQYGGDCQISVSDGDLRGSIVIVPCSRIARMERAAVQAPVAVEETVAIEETASVEQTVAITPVEIAVEPSADAPAPPLSETDRATAEPAPAPEALAPEDLDPNGLCAEPLPDTFAAQIPAPEIAETPADLPAALPVDLDGVPMDAAVTVDPGLLPNGRPAARVASPPRPSRPAGPNLPLAIPPNPDGTAKIGW